MHTDCLVPRDGTAPELQSLPIGFPGETIYSRLCRFHLLVSDFASRPVLRRLFNAPFCIPSSLIPARLDQLHLYFKGKLKIDAVIEENTALPFFRPFMTRQQWSQAYASVLAGRSVGLHCATGIAASRITPAHEIRLCDKCVAEDLRLLGVSYWHREHSLPGNLVCCDHEIGLRSASTIFRLSRHALWLPHEILNQCPPVPAFSTGEITSLLEIAAATTRVLDRSQLPVGLEAMRDTYLQKARQIGFVAGQQSISHQRLNDAVANKWSNLSSLPAFRWITGANWAGMIRKPRSSKHPLRHIILAGALGLSVEELLGLSPAKDCAPEAPHAPTANRRIRLDKHSGELPTSCATVRDIAASLDVSVTTAIIRAARSGIQVSKRPKKLTAARVEQVESMYAQGLTVAEVCSTQGISSSSAWRILVSNAELHERWKCVRLTRAREEYRSIWAEAQASNPGMLLSSTRKQHPAVYAWLYRNDRVWLSEGGARRDLHAAPKRPSNTRSSEDWVLSTAVVKAAKTIRSAEPPAGRASRRRIAILARVPRPVAADANRFPLIAAAFNKSEESIDEYQVRRIRYWTNLLLNELGEAPRWLVIRKGGIRKPISDRVCAELTTLQDELRHNFHRSQTSAGQEKDQILRPISARSG